MKKIIPLLLLFTACNNNEPKKEVEKTKEKVEETQDLESLSNLELQMSPEKVSLLSIIKGIPRDSVFMILNDYKTKIPDEIFIGDDKMKVERVIDSISQLRHMSKKRIASLIFSFNYELITKEEMKNQDEDNSSDDE